MKTSGFKPTRLKPTLLSAFAAGACLVAAAAFAEAHFGKMIVADSEDADTSQQTFAPDTPKIYVNAELVDVASGAKLSADWIAEKTDAAPANYKIDSVTLTTGSLMNAANFSLSKPTAGWPTGDYRVDLFIDGKPAGAAHFKIAK